jgi:two-component system cell cycle sensor histidine kinase/response regulator CckA
MAAPRILVVEDETIVAMDIAQGLRQLGYGVVGTAGTGEEALELAKRGVPDLVLMDINLRGSMDGIETAKALQLRRAVPVLFLTAHADAATVQRAKEASPYGYLVKPYDQRDLHRSIELALSKAAGDRNTLAHAAAELWNSEERYRLLVDAMTDHAIVTIDGAGRIATWSAGAEKLFGWSAEEVLGRQLTELFPVDLNASEPIDEVLLRVRHGERVERDEWRQRKDGSRFLARAIRFPVKGEDGSAMATVALIRDVTRERALAADQLEAQKLESLGKLAGGVAHDFNNMLMVIFSRCDILERRGGLTTEQLRFLGDIRAAATRNRALTQQLLAAARRQYLEPEVVDMSEAVSSAMQLLGPTLGEHIAVRTELEPNPWPIYADPSKLHQVILNLTINARDAMSEGGVLTIETRNVCVDAAYAKQKLRMREGDYVSLAVSDSGCGIPEEIRDRVFDPFFTSKSGVGSGLGLAVVRGVVEQTGGQVWMYSEVGKGTTFKIYFPRYRGEVPIPESPAAPVETERGSGTILLVEDEQLLRSVIREALEENGYQVVEARSPAEALAALRQSGQHVDLLLSDVVLPGINGFELAEEVRRVRPEIRIVFMSGYTDKAIKGDRPLLDAPFLEKPISTSQLLSALRSALRAGDA